MAVTPIPKGYHSITPYLVIHGAAAAIRFYERAFGAVETQRMEVPVPGGEGAVTIAHAELRIGDSMLTLSDEWPTMDVLGPRARGGATGGVLLYVEDVDAAYARAVEAGAVGDRRPADQFYGDRTGSLTDPFGHRWQLATHIEDVSPEELQRRTRKAFGLDEAG